MWIKRDIFNIFNNDTSSVIQILLGPRQCGKSSLLWKMGKSKYQEVTLDNMQERILAQKDPAMFLSTKKFPLIIDEVQYAPNLFHELKIYVDRIKRERLNDINRNIEDIRIRLTGSNLLFLEKNIKESLVGRASTFFLNTLSVNEIKKSIPDYKIIDILFRGGLPELYADSNIDLGLYLDNYIRNYIEKDIVMSAGIEKRNEFSIVLGLLATRTANLLNKNDISKESGIKVPTTTEWISVLESSDIVHLLKPFSTNLNNRLVKTSKLFFMDTGLVTRLQGWQSVQPIINSPLAGHLFETLVFAEIAKYIKNNLKNWNIYFWRTKEGEEIDFLIETEKNKIYPIEAKMSINAVNHVEIPKSFKKIFSKTEELVIVCLDGEDKYISKTSHQVPIAKLVNYLDTLS